MSSQSEERVESINQSIQEQAEELEEDPLHKWPYIPNWCPASLKLMREIETKILNHLIVPYKGEKINLGPILNSSDKDVIVRTISLNQDNESNNVPIVFVHGFAASLVQWLPDLNKLIELGCSQPLLLFDLPGFGRSSRSTFSPDAKEAEEQFVSIIEKWRVRMKIERMILIGHSFGSFLSFNYSLRHPQRIAHLLLSDPWGMKQAPKKIFDSNCSIPVYQRLGLKAVTKLPFNLLSYVRLLGPMGPLGLRYFRSGLISKYKKCIPKASFLMSNYIFQNVAQEPTGEIAFKNMGIDVAWAKNPMCSRLKDLDQNIPMTLVYGSKSPLDHLPIEKVRELRGDSFIDFHVLEGGHEAFVGQVDSFAEIIMSISRKINDSKLQNLQS